MTPSEHIDRGTHVPPRLCRAVPLALRRRWCGPRCVCAGLRVPPDGAVHKYSTISRRSLTRRSRHHRGSHAGFDERTQGHVNDAAALRARLYIHKAERPFARQECSLKRGPGRNRRESARLPGKWVHSRQLNAQRPRMAFGALAVSHELEKHAASVRPERTAHVPLNTLCYRRKPLPCRFGSWAMG